LWDNGPEIGVELAVRTENRKVGTQHLGSVVDRDSLNPDPDPAFQVNPDPDKGRFRMRIQDFDD
jgi:hypothetical protein